MNQRSLLFTWLLVLPTIGIYAQVPQGIAYQAVARDGNSILANAFLQARFSIEISGTLVYQEEHSVQTNQFGLFTANIGEGTPNQGTFSGINWEVGDADLVVELNQGAGFELLGTSKLQSVPFSLYAERAENVDLSLNDLMDVSASGVNPDEVLKWDGSQWVTDQDNVQDADSDASNELQTLSLSGNDLSLSNGGGTVSINAGATYTAGSGISISGTTISNSGDIDASDDITTSTSAGGDLSGTYPNPSVSSLAGQALGLGATPPVSGQVLKWNGSQWTAANDNAGSSVWNTSGSNAYYNSGDVGIGTTSIDAKVEVYHNSSLSDPHMMLHENGNDYARLNFKNNNGSNYWSIASYIASNHRNDRLNFWNGVGGDVVTITGDGEVGIGVGISPKVPFHVGNGRRVLFGIDTLGNGDKLMFLPDLHAFRVGTIATGAASTYWNRDSIGEYSFASGYNTRAQGLGATAMGRDTEATNSYAHATGYFSNADGLYSTAMGFNTDAFGTGATALGYSTDAEANYTFAAGRNTEAQAIYSTALGRYTLAQSYASTAVGSYNVGGGSATAWNATDPIFEIGIGNSSSARANAMTVRKNGNVGIGTTAPGESLQVNGKIRFAGLETLEDGGANEIAARADLRSSVDNFYDLGTASFRWDDVYATNGTIITSDRRDKRNIQDLDYGLAEILKLRPVRYEWKDRPERGQKLGLIAQEIQPVIKEVVKSHDFKALEDGGEVQRVELERLGVYYSDLIPVLIKATQEQQALIEQQQKHIEQLEKRLKKLE